MDLWGNEDEDEYRARKRAEIFSSSYHFENYGMLENAIHRCRLCPLCDEGGRGPVLSTGPIDAPLMIVGEGPGGVEDEYGVPLVGPSGKLLDKALWSVGLTRDRIYVTNIVKCRPHNNRTPTLDEGRFCADLHLRAEIEAVKPAVIVCRGKVAFQYFYGSAGSIMRNRGKWLDYEKIPVMPTYHPAFFTAPNR